MIVLQQAVPEVTLDQAVLGALATFANGCNFTLFFDSYGAPHLGIGCYGLHLGLMSGHENLLYEWWTTQVCHPRGGFVPLPIRQDTIAFLKERRPCKRCGGFQFEEKK